MYSGLSVASSTASRRDAPSTMSTPSPVEDPPRAPRVTFAAKTAPFIAAIHTVWDLLRGGSARNVAVGTGLSGKPQAMD